MYFATEEHQTGFTLDYVTRSFTLHIGRRMRCRECVGETSLSSQHIVCYEQNGTQTQGYTPNTQEWLRHITDFVATPAVFSMPSDLSKIFSICCHGQARRLQFI